MDQSTTDAILDGPALAPPPGVEANFENPQNLSHPALAVLQLVVVTVVVGMRVYTKLGVVRKMLAEDYWLIVAWLCFAGFHVIAFMFEALPLGVHQWDLTARKAIVHARLFHIAVTVYALIIVPLKISLILQIRRIFIPHTHSLHARPALLWLIDSFLVLNLIFYTALILFQFLACRPLAHAWNPLIAGSCVPDRNVVHIISASINTASDLIIVILPQPVIWRLELGRPRKCGLSAVFLLGGLACAASAIRLYYAVQLYSSTDQSYRGAQMGKWAEPELTFGFLAACLPVLPALLKHVVGSPLGRGVRGLWTGEEMGRSGCGCGRKRMQRGVRTIESYGRGGDRDRDRSRGREKGRITKMVEMDVEFEELTRESGDGLVCAAAETRRGSSHEASRGSSQESNEECGAAATGLGAAGPGAAKPVNHHHTTSPLQPSTIHAPN